MVGKLTVNYGSMFSGKTEELFRMIRRYKVGGKQVKLFKPAVDGRYSADEIVTHYGDRFKCNVVDVAEDILKSDLSKVDVVGIDEGQFLDEGLVGVVRELKKRGLDVVVSGLDMWSSGEPIRVMADLGAIANDVNKFKAVCNDTGEDAYISFSVVEKESDVQVGGTESYIALSERAVLMREGDRLLEERGD